MSKFTTAAAVTLLSAALAAPAFAQMSSSTSSMSTGTASSIDLACMSAAIDARESAVVTARAKYHASIMAALNTRHAALKAALTLANNNDRMVAMQAAWKSYVTATEKARAQFAIDVKAAWSVFATAKVNCHIDGDDADRPAAPKKGERGNKKDDRENRGWHLGWFKGWLRNGAGAKAGADVDSDASVKASTHTDTKVKVNGGLKLDLSL